MWVIVKVFRRPPTGRAGDRDGGFPRLSGSVARALRCPASPQTTRLAENLGKPSLGVTISAPWYYVRWPDAGPFISPAGRHNRIKMTSEKVKASRNFNKSCGRL